MARKAGIQREEDKKKPISEELPLPPPSEGQLNKKIHHFSESKDPTHDPFSIPLFSFLSLSFPFFPFLFLYFPLCFPLLFLSFPLLLLYFSFTFLFFPFLFLSFPFFPFLFLYFPLCFPLLFLYFSLLEKMRSLFRGVGL